MSEPQNANVLHLHNVSSCLSDIKASALYAVYKSVLERNGSTNTSAPSASEEQTTTTIGRQFMWRVQRLRQLKRISLASQKRNARKWLPWGLSATIDKKSSRGAFQGLKNRRA